MILAKHFSLLCFLLLLLLTNNAVVKVSAHAYSDISNISNISSSSRQEEEEEHEQVVVEEDSPKSTMMISDSSSNTTTKNTTTATEIDEEDDDEDDKEEEAQQQVTDEVCTLCPMGESSPTPNREIDFYDTTCSGFDWFLQTSYKKDSLECYGSQYLMSSFCGCSHSLTSSSTTTTTTTSDSSSSSSSPFPPGPPKEPCQICPNSDMTQPKAIINSYDPQLGFAPTCEWAEAFLFGQVESDDLGCLVSQAYNFRCGCSKGYGFGGSVPLFPSQAYYNAIVCVAGVLALISILASSYMIYDIVIRPLRRGSGGGDSDGHHRNNNNNNNNNNGRRDSKWRTSLYHQLILLWSISTILFMISYGLGPVPTLQYDEDNMYLGRVGAYGNEVTCKIQGFFLRYGYSQAMFCHVLICIYFYLIVVKRWTGRQTTMYRKWFLIPPILLSLVVASSSVPFIEAEFLYCDIDTNNNIHTYFLIPGIICTVIVTYLMVIICYRVRKTEQASKKYRFCFAAESQHKFRSSATNVNRTVRKQDSYSSFTIFGSRLQLSSDNNNNNNNNNSAAEDDVSPEETSSSCLSFGSSEENTRRSRSTMTGLEKEVYIKCFLFGTVYYLCYPLILAILFVSNANTVQHTMRFIVSMIVPISTLSVFYIYTEQYKKKWSKQILHYTSCCSSCSCCSDCEISNDDSNNDVIGEKRSSSNSNENDPSTMESCRPTAGRHSPQGEDTLLRMEQDVTPKRMSSFDGGDQEDEQSIILDYEMPIKEEYSDGKGRSNITSGFVDPEKQLTSDCFESPRLDKEVLHHKERVTSEDEPRWSEMDSESVITA